MTREQLKQDVIAIIKMNKDEISTDWDDVCNYIELIARMAAYMDSLEGEGWQPIDTAPKGITCILTYDYKSVYEGSQDLEGHDGMWFSGSWEVSIPIAWMPLPTPPKQGE